MQEGPGSPKKTQKQKNAKKQNCNNLENRKTNIFPPISPNSRSAAPAAYIMNDIENVYSLWDTKALRI